MKKKKEEPKIQEEEVLSEEEVQSLEEGAKQEKALADRENPKDVQEALFQKMEEDIALFHALFPQVKGEEIPPEVWERVEKGESLAAAYALYFVKKMREDEKIRAVNEENEKKAPPRIRHDGAEGEYFSPEAVKSMSRKEIQKNYDAILRSMEKWN